MQKICSSSAAPSGPTIKAPVYADAISKEKAAFEKCRPIEPKLFSKTEAWKHFSDTDQVEIALAAVRLAVILPFLRVSASRTL
jgi:hypothetical protein